MEAAGWLAGCDGRPGGDICEGLSKAKKGRDRIEEGMWVVRRRDQMTGGPRLYRESRCDIFGLSI